MPDTMSDADAAPAKPKERHAPRGQAPRPVVCRDDKESLIAWLAIELGDPELRRALTKCTHIVKARNVILARSRNKHIAEAAESLKHDATANNIVERACAQCSRTKEAAAILAHWNKLRSWQKGVEEDYPETRQGQQERRATLGLPGEAQEAPVAA